MIKRVISVNISGMKTVNAEKKLIDKLIDECTETIEEVKLAKITLAENESSYTCIFCTVYTVLF